MNKNQTNSNRNLFILQKKESLIKFYGREMKFPRKQNQSFQGLKFENKSKEFSSAQKSEEILDDKKKCNKKLLKLAGCRLYLTL